MNTTIRAGLGAALALALVGAGATAATAADAITPDGYFAGTVYLADQSTGEFLGDGPFAYDYGVIAMAAPDDLDAMFPIPSDATGAWTFIAPQGQESDASKWNAKAIVGLTPGGISLPDITPMNIATIGTGTPAGTLAVQATGGDYSIGLAFTKANGVTVVQSGLFYQHVHVTAGSGEWTASAVCDGTLGDCGGGTPTPTPTPSASAGSADQNLNADVAAPVDGVLGLVAPASATSTIGNATIVDGQSKSVGELGEFTVQDGRVASKPGWDLTVTSVGDFVNGSTTISKANLGFAPTLVSGTASLGTAQVAGSAAYPTRFAQLASGNAGTTVLNADLVFLAPAGSPAGTYTSTLTVTLVSN